MELAGARPFREFAAAEGRGLPLSVSCRRVAPSHFWGVWITMARACLAVILLLALSASRVSGEAPNPTVA